MKLSQILERVDYKIVKGNVECEITGIAYDSRKVEKGYLFVAMRGFNTDGHNYIDQAVKKGAVAVIGEIDDAPCDCYIKSDNTRKAIALVSAAFYNYPANKMKIVGVTGTNGKTTTTYLIKQILDLKGYKCGIIGTNNILIGEKVIPAQRTTPESLELHEIFSQMLQEGVEYVIMEVSSHALVLDRVYGIEFDTAVFTNITQDHLDFHKTMDEYAKAKAILFTMAKNAAINMDDEYKDVIIKNATCNIRGYAIDKKADIVAEDLKMSERGVIFNLVSKNTKRNMRIGIPGRFSVYNALASIAACQCMEISDDDIEKGLILAKSVKGRLEVVHTKTPYTVIIDYAHTPDGLENIIKAVKGFAKGRVITLFGCGGDRDSSKRPKMGEIAVRLSDYCIVTSDNPRSENPSLIIKDILEGMKGKENKYTVIENRRDAIEYALDFAKENDVIILAGKGHETYQILNEGTIHFDEREIIKELLSKKAL